MIQILAGVPKALTLKYKSDPQLVLAHLILSDKKYAEMLRDGGFEYLILDNSAWESNARDISKLVKIAKEIPAIKEIILPDVFGDFRATRKASVDALKFLHDNGLQKKWNFMYVIHGRTVQTRINQVKWVVESDEAQDISVIGIPAHELGHSVASDTHTRKLLMQINKLRLEYGGKRMYSLKFHLLGVPYRIYLIYHFATMYSWLQRLDTTFPMKAAYMGVHITPVTTKDDLYNASSADFPTYDSLKRKFFDLQIPPRDAGLASYNIGIMRAWGEGGNKHD